MTRVMGVIDFGQYDNIRQEKRLDTQLNERIIDVLKANIEQQAKEIEALKLCCPKCGGVTGKLEVLNVPAKTLTDEEMLEIYKKVFNKQNEFKENLKRRSYFDFARAILRKASEK